MSNVEQLFIVDSNCLRPGNCSNTPAEPNVGTSDDQGQRRVGTDAIADSQYKELQPLPRSIARGKSTLHTFLRRVLDRSHFYRRWHCVSGQEHRVDKFHEEDKDGGSH